MVDDQSRSSGSTCIGLFRTKDYWIPLVILGGIFFVVMPVILLGSLGLVQRSPTIGQIGQIIGTLPDSIQQNIQGEQSGNSGPHTHLRCIFSHR